MITTRLDVFNFSKTLNEEEMHLFAQAFAKNLSTSTCIALWGDLGSGKTTFCRSLIQALMEDPGLYVPSPTFSLIQIYHPPQGNMIWHCDLYRLKTPEEVEELGLLEAFSQHLCLIEWPDRLGHYLPENRVDIKFEVVGEGKERCVTIKLSQLLQ